MLDSYFLPLCLYYHPAEICGACLILANSCFQEEFRITVLNDGEWLRLINKGLSIDTCNQIALHIEEFVVLLQNTFKV